MYKIIRKERLNLETTLLEVEAGDISLAARAGQFVILRVDEFGERFPLTLYDWDKDKGTITVVCQAIGVSTKKLSALNEGDSIMDISGPLGNATNTKDVGKVICIGGGVGIAEAYPIARAMYNNGNDVKVIIGSRTKDLLICEKELKSFCDNVFITSDDGSYERKGYVSDVLRELLSADKYDLVFAIGPVPMMRVVADITKTFNVKTEVSLNSIMIDGTGMCGVCRIQYDGETKFTCCDGPEFDAHKVDFDDLIVRISQYKTEEKDALRCHDGKCKLGLDEE